MTTTVPANTLLGRPSWGLALCGIASLVPVVVLLRPQPHTAPTSFGDVVFFGVFVVPQLLAWALSAIQRPFGRTLTVAAAGLGLGMSVLAVPVYGLGLLFLAQSAAATVVAVRRLS